MREGRNAVCELELILPATWAKGVTHLLSLWGEPCEGRVVISGVVSESLEGYSHVLVSQVEALLERVV